jgi:uncharacterized protein (DUF1778 family)
VPLDTPAHHAFGHDPGFVVFAALGRANSRVREQASTVVSAAYFDRLLASLDEPEDAPGLRRSFKKTGTPGTPQGTP